MGRHDLKRGRSAAAIAVASLIISGGAVYPFIGAGTAQAAPVPPWNTTATAMTGTGSEAWVLDVVVAADGSAVALWNQTPPSGGERKLYGAVRPAGSNTWGEPHLFATTPTSSGDVKLLASADGTVTAAWAEFPNETGPYAGTRESRLMTAVLPAGGASWSDPVEVVPVTESVSLDGIDLAEGPDDSVTAVWYARATQSSGWEVSTTTRGADGGWSEPVQVSKAAADGADAAFAPSVAVSSDGTTVIAYDQADNALEDVRTVTRPAGGTAWGEPVQVTAVSQGSNHPQLAASGDGSLTMVWASHVGEESAPRIIKTATLAHGASAWSAPEQVSPTDDLVETPEPLVAPNGDVTLVWVDWTSTFSTRTATRDADDDTWSAPRTLSTGYVSEQYDASIGADGTVRAIWTETDPDDTGRVLMESALADGSWSRAAELPGSANRFVHGQVAAGDEGAATAVWSGTDSNDLTRLFGSRTAWPEKLSVSNSAVPSGIQLRGTTSSDTAWAPTWKLSRPVSSWSVTLTDTAGRTVRTLTGTTDDLTVAPVWNGRTESGKHAPNGRLTWALRATDAGSGNDTAVASGSVTVAGGAAVHRDHGGSSSAPDGIGDVLTLNSSGGLTYQLGKYSTGTFSGKTSGSGWSTSVKPVPFGDLSGDRCNDVLVRLSSGELRLYKPGCGAAVEPSTAYTSLGTGWGQYDVLTSPGDVSGDGRPDLVARNASTGAVYLYQGTSTGKLSSRVKLYDDWRGYKKIVGVGDLNGDGHGDLLLQNSANDLWRRYGTGTGTFGSRVKVFGDWGGSYNVVVGVGDLTGDGKADIISRDSSGNVYRNNGDGKGSFSARTQVATGWGGYKGLY